MQGVWTYNESLPPKKDVASVNTTFHPKREWIDHGVQVEVQPAVVATTPVQPKVDPILKTFSEPEVKIIIPTKANETKPESITTTDASPTETTTPTTTSTGKKNPISVAKAPKRVKTGSEIRNPMTVEFLPIFPGCEKLNTNNERAICFQERVKRLITRKFDNGLGSELGLKGRQRIILYFEINERGLVANIKARHANKDLADEAIRVAKLLPAMQPARQGNENVKMSYTLPIVLSTRE